MNHTESLVAWYLRFNGYFTTPNFTTHPDFKKEAGSSDADVLAVRFQHSHEYQQRFRFERDPYLVREVPVDFVVAEVKSSTCALNENWTNPAQGNVEYALRWIGRWSDPAVIDRIAENVYKAGEWIDSEKGDVVRFVCFGETVNETVSVKYPVVSQILLRHVIEWVRSRMTKNCYQAHREQWEPFIVELGQRFQSDQTDKQILEWIVGRPPVGEWICSLDNEQALTSLQTMLEPPSSLSRRERRLDIIGGLKVEVFANEHPPPHFRVSYGSETANYRIKDCLQLNGDLRRYYRIIRSWHSGNRGKLIATWNAFRPSNCPVGPFTD